MQTNILEPEFLLNLFDRFTSFKWLIVKKNAAFPNYSPGDDIDVFVFDINKALQFTADKLSEKVAQDSSLSITVEKSENKAHLDLRKNNKIELRFDFYEAMPDYKNLKVKSGLFCSMLETRQELIIGSHSIYIPSDKFEMIFRYMEYNEYFASNPDKLKHAEFVFQKLTAENNEQFFSSLHYYIALPNHEPYRPTRLVRFKTNIGYIKVILKKSIKSIKQDGIIEFFKLIYRRVK